MKFLRIFVSILDCKYIFLKGSHVDKRKISNPRHEKKRKKKKKENSGGHWISKYLLHFTLIKFEPFGPVSLIYQTKYHFIIHYKPNISDSGKSH